MVTSAVKWICHISKGILVILKTGFIILFIGLDELNPVIPVEFVPVALATDSSVACCVQNLHMDCWDEI